MKKLFMLSCVFGLSNVYSSTLEWGDLDLNQRYQLNQNINIENVISYKMGDKFEMLDRIGGEIPVIYFQMHSVKCENPNLTSEMILINPNPKDTSTDRTIAIQLEENCNLGMWVEVKDYYSPSIYSEDQE